jgi:hypothetical protein
MGLLAGSARAEEPRLADYFGFLPLEIYKLDPRIGNLVLADFDGDKINDIAVINNGRSRIDLLLSGKKPEEGERTPGLDTNEVANDRRMRLVSVPVNKEVVSLQAGDLNGDGKPDLAFYGTPAEVVVLPNEGNGSFGSPRMVNSGEAVESGTALSLGDLNRDGRLDIALLGSNEIVVVYQREDGRLSEPERLPHTAANPRMLKAIDMDGDGGDDLVLLDGGSDDPVRIRFSVEANRLGPEQRFAVETPKAIAFGQIDGKKGSEFLTIEGQSGRARVFTLAEADDSETGRKGRLIFYPLPPGSERGRSLALGDLDGDKKTDVVVTDPANARFLVYRQGQGGLGTSQSFPGLLEGRTVRMADLDGDGKAEVYVLSEQEKQIGRSVLADGRLTFPTPLPLSGEPVAMDLADLDGDKTPEVAYVARTRSKGSDVYALRALAREKSGTFVPYRWGLVDEVVLKDTTDAPTAIRVIDVNRDGEADVLVFNASGSPTLLLGRAGGEPPAPAGGSLGQLAAVTPAGLNPCELNGPALLVVQNTFARNILLDKQGNWQIKDQYDTERSAAQVVGAAALDTDGDGVKEVVLLDRTSKSLVYLALKKKEGVYRPAGTLSVGPIDFQGMHVADLDGDGRDDLLLAGSDRFGVVLTGRKGLRLKPLASYESSRTEARLSDLAVGDLNADGQPDVVLSDLAEHFIEIITYQGQAKLNLALSFKIFERKSLRDLHNLVEPRDLAVGDVDGDGADDLVLIVHDRVLVYRQDSGKLDEAKSK